MALSFHLMPLSNRIAGIIKCREIQSMISEVVTSGMKSLTGFIKMLNIYTLLNPIRWEGFSFGKIRLD
jgi:hypothetical protein